MERVVRHPFTGFESNSLGESRRKTFGPDVETWVDAVDDGPDATQPRGQDLTVLSRAVLYADGSPPTNWSAHDEWTARGRRWLQDGDTETWVDPFTGPVGWSVRLARSQG